MSDSEPDAELAVGADAFVDRGAGRQIAVVGAGAVGATAAYDLASAGADVTLYDRDTVAGGATGRAAGLCYDAFADERDAAIAGEAIERFRAFSGDDTFPFVECPYVWFAREGDTARAEAIRDGIARMQEHGVVALELDADGLADRFPALATDDVAVAGIAGAAGYADPARYTACLAAAATGAGATLETNTPVEIRTDPAGVVLPDGEYREYDAVLVAAGAHTKALLGGADVPIAMKPYRVQALVASGSLSEPMCYDASAGYYLRPHADGILAGDGAVLSEADPDEYDPTADAEFVDDLVSKLETRLPEASLSVERSWAGLCTTTPDRDPLVGRVRDGLYVATGFDGEGFMRAPAIGDRVAELILEEEAAGDFDPTRFDGTESFDIEVGMAVNR
ncbi:FAD-binding oxidoreductase [Halobacteria archaeon AArc-dxtr1]|nr:FAD-binding oxidoreductase [Halobacteria archaeon AArc-dxtr1]